MEINKSTLLNLISDLDISPSNINEIRKIYEILDKKIELYDLTKNNTEIEDLIKSISNTDLPHFNIISLENIELDEDVCNKCKILTFEIYLDKIPIIIKWGEEHYWTSNAGWTDTNIIMNNEKLSYGSAVELLVNQTTDNNIKFQIVALFKAIEEVFPELDFGS